MVLDFRLGQILFWLLFLLQVYGLIVIVQVYLYLFLAM